VPDEELKTLQLVTIGLGLISIVNMIVLGAYIVSYCLALAFLGRFQMEANVVGLITALSVSLVLYGCYSVYGAHFFRGGICNLVAGTITIGIYLYYTLNLPLLQRLGPLGYFLLIPALMSGVIGIVISKQQHRES